MREKRLGRLGYKFGKVAQAQQSNILHNGDFQVAQRGAGPFTSATLIVNNDDSYLLDQWVFLANGSDTCDVSQNTTVIPTNGVASILLDVETGSRKFGIINFVEAANARKTLGQAVSFAFQLIRVGTSISVIKVGVLSWQGTADTITSDVVSSWNAVGTDPTLVANWTYENTPTTITPTTSWQRAVVENVLIDTASTSNIAIFIWVDNTDSVIGDFLYISDANLTLSSQAQQNIVHRSISEETAICQRYFIQYDAGASATFRNIASGFADSSTDAECIVHLPVTMRTRGLPTFPSTVSDYALNIPGATEVACTVVTGGVDTPQTASINATVAAGLITGRSVIFGTTVATGVMLVSAEL